MTQVNLQNCTPISIEFKQAISSTRPDKYVVKMGSIKGNYSVPQEASNMAQTAGILLDQFYADHNMELPKNGFNLFRVGSIHLATPLQD